jgi:hypothetical protein
MKTTKTTKTTKSAKTPKSSNPLSPKARARHREATAALRPNGSYFLLATFD